MRSLSRSFVVLLSLLALSTPAFAYRMSAWVPAWDSSAVTIMGRHSGDIDESNPGWFTARADGTIAKSSGGETPTLRSALSRTQLVPTIKNYINGAFDGELMATIVNSPELREKHADAIAALAVQNAYDGIDIDYERMPSSSKAGFTAFVQSLSAKLHARNKVLSVTVYAKTSDATWKGPGAQDWPAIGAAADSVKIMAYDNHWSTSAAGPIAPLPWLEQIVAYAAKTLPLKKVLIGLPWYGYDWLAQNGTAVTYAEAMTRAQNAGVPVERDANGEAMFTYGSRTVYFQDATSYRRKVETIIARYPGIGGFAHWRVGAEDPAIWNLVGELHSSGKVPAEAPKKDFRIEGPAAIMTAAGTGTSAQFGFVAINGFNDAVRLSARSLDAFGGTVTTTGTSLSVSVPATTAPGTYRILVTMSAGSINREQVVALQVTAARASKRRATR